MFIHRVYCFTFLLFSPSNSGIKDYSIALESAELFQSHCQVSGLPVSPSAEIIAMHLFP